MNAIRIYAFADEASGQIDGQIAAMRRNGLSGLEIRGVDGQNIAEISLDKAREVRRKLDDAGLTVWSMGSPIGKVPIETDAFAEHLDKLRHVLELAHVLGAENVRLFSFYTPEGRKEEFRGKVIDWMGRMLDTGKGCGVALCHENEKGIYGDTADRCLDLLNAFPDLNGIFDPANFIQCGQDTLQAWSLLKRRIKYLHIKDALADGRVVPSGRGIGHIQEILRDYRAMGGDAVTVEPHLSVFEGLKDLEQSDQKTKLDAYCYPNGDAAFDAACGALKRLL
ncbi:MAG: sugar phosphate isomerase/epimerase [Clostridia bacterium]|nr:sugar phosphate isomerase/epimerase [Clostridia bacterium]